MHDMNIGPVGKVRHWEEIWRGLVERYRSRKLRGFEEPAEEGLLSFGHT